MNETFLVVKVSAAALYRGLLLFIRTINPEKEKVRINTRQYFQDWCTTLQHVVLFTPQSTIKRLNRSFTKRPAAGLAKYHHLCGWRVTLKWGRAHCYAHSLLHSSLFLVRGWWGTAQHVLTETIRQNNLQSLRKSKWKQESSHCHCALSQITALCNLEKYLWKLRVLFVFSGLQWPLIH